MLWEKKTKSRVGDEGPGGLNKADGAGGAGKFNRGQGGPIEQVRAGRAPRGSQPGPCRGREFQREKSYSGSEPGLWTREAGAGGSEETCIAEVQ